MVECRLKPDDQEFTILHVLQQSPYAAHYTEGFRVSNIKGIVRLVLFQIFARCLYLFFIYIDVEHLSVSFIFNFEHKVMDDMDDMEVSLELEYEAEEMLKPLAERTHLKPWWASL